jgi:hypothetical protein
MQFGLGVIQMINYNQITEEDAKQLVRCLCEKATNLTTVIEPVQGPTPANQYMAVRLMSVESLQHEVDDWVDDEENDTLSQMQKGESRLHFRIMARGKNAYNNLLKVRACMRHPNRWIGGNKSLPIPERFKDAPLWEYFGLSGIEDIQIITVEELGKIWEGAYFNVFFYANLNTDYSETVPTFKWLDINVDLNEDIIKIEVNKPQFKKKGKNKNANAK